MKIPFLLFVSLAITGVSKAQEGGKPSPPFVSPLPNDIEFTKTFTYPQAKPSQDAQQAAVQKFLGQFARVRSIDVIKVGTTLKGTSTYSDGSTSVSWLWNNYLLQSNSQHPAEATALPVATLDANTRHNSTPSLLDAAWIGLNSYTGEQTRGGHQYFVYKKGDQTAWIDEATKLPAFFVSPQQTIVYTYKVAPAGPLDPPDNFKKEVLASQNSYGGGPP